MWAKVVEGILFINISGWERSVSCLMPDSGVVVTANNAAKRIASLWSVAQTSRPPRHQGLHLQRDQRRRVPQPWRSAHQTHPPGAGALHLCVSTRPFTISHRSNWNNLHFRWRDLSSTKRHVIAQFESLDKFWKRKPKWNAVWKILFS